LAPQLGQQLAVETIPVGPHLDQLGLDRRQPLGQPGSSTRSAVTSSSRDWSRCLSATAACDPATVSSSINTSKAPSSLRRRVRRLPRLILP
jgi:hypothetical protein